MAIINVTIGSVTLSYPLSNRTSALGQAPLFIMKMKLFKQEMRGAVLTGCNMINYDNIMTIVFINTKNQ